MDRTDLDAKAVAHIATQTNVLFAMLAAFAGWFIGNGSEVEPWIRVVTWLEVYVAGIICLRSMSSAHSWYHIKGTKDEADGGDVSTTVKLFNRKRDYGPDEFIDLLASRLSRATILFSAAVGGVGVLKAFRSLA